jgi:pimeloyl-ACP methyl ester carboxylesterase
VVPCGLPGSAYEWRGWHRGSPSAGARRTTASLAPDPRPDDSYTVQNGAELIALLERSPRRRRIVGWSYGSATALAAARQDPARMAGLVLVERRPRRRAWRPPAVFRLLFSDVVLAGCARCRRSARMRPPHSGCVQRAADAGWWRPAWPPTSPARRRAWREEGRLFNASPVPDPAGLALPVLVIHGTDDRLVAMEVGRELARRASDARLVAVENGSHMLPITHPELLATEIAGFPATTR